MEPAFFNRVCILALFNLTYSYMKRYFLWKWPLFLIFSGFYAAAEHLPRPLPEKRIFRESYKNKITSPVRQALDRAEHPGMAKIRANDKAQGRALPLVSVNSRNEMHVYLHITNANSNVLASLENLGVRVELISPNQRKLQAFVPLDQMEAVAAIPQIRSISSVIPPEIFAGNTLTAGDSIHRCDRVRSILGMTGSGIKVGVISDGVDGLSTAQSSGDLPSGVNVIDNSAGGAEGTAMMEIIHDLAPGAQLLFHSGVSGQLTLIEAYKQLHLAGARVIVDDLRYRDEPMFEDGQIAQYVRSLAIDSGTIIVCSAGNNGDAHYEAAYVDVNPASNSNAFNGGNDAHDFGSGDKTLTIGLHANATVIVTLQWNDPFGSASNDYDLYIMNEAASTSLAKSVTTQNGDDDPIEVAGYQAGNDSMTLNIVVDKYKGSDRTFELFFSFDTITPYLEYVVDSSSLYGHHAVDSILTVAAVSAFEDGWDQVQPYSSRGSVRLFFPSETVRPKPELTGVDAVNISGAGGFASWFFGTSAAAPHVAAIVALALQAKPTQTSFEVRDLLMRTAVDIEDAGFDYKSGHGRADAYAAISELLNNPPAITNIPDQTVDRGGSFAAISLDDYVADEDHADAEITWQSSGQSQLTVGIDGNRVATIQIPNASWAGAETVKFVATDPGGAKDSSSVLFTVTATNRPPVVSSPLDSVMQARADSASTLVVATSDPDGDALTYKWFVNGTEDPGDKDSVYSVTPASAGTLSVKVEVSDNAATVSHQWKLAVQAVGLGPRLVSLPAEPILEAPGIVVSGQVRVNLLLPKPEKTILTLFNVAGKEIARSSERLISRGSHCLQMDVNGNGSSGVCFLHVRTGKHVWVRRMLLLP